MAGPAGFLGLSPLRRVAPRRRRQDSVEVPRGPGSRDVDLVVVVNGFPRLSETFVLHELLDLERRGLRLHLIALRDPEEVVEHAALGDLAARVEYLTDLTLS